MYDTKDIMLDVTKAVTNWITFLDSLLSEYDESSAFKLYNVLDDTLFYDNLSESDKYILNDYLNNHYILPLNIFVSEHGYELIRVIDSNVHTGPDQQIVINLLMRVRDLTE